MDLWKLMEMMEKCFFSRQFMEVHGKWKLIGIDGIMGVTSV